MNDELIEKCRLWIAESGEGLSGAEHPNAVKAFYDFVHELLQEHHNFDEQEIREQISEVFPRIDTISDRCSNFINKWFTVYEHIKAYNDEYGN